MTGSSLVLRRYNFIDSLRGLAIILVLIAHVNLYGTLKYSTFVNSLTTQIVGPRGVQLFFLVSAFTLCLSFDKRKLIEKNFIRNFYIRRFFRIAPMFYFAIIYYLWQEFYFSGNPQHFSLENILSTLLFINGFFPLWINNIVLGGWSVAVEFTFYLFFPLLFYLLKNVRISILITFISLFIFQALRLYLLSLHIVQKTPDLQTFTFQFFPSQVPVFLMGITVFNLIKKPLQNKEKKIFLVFVFIAIVFAFFQLMTNVKLIAGYYVFGFIFSALLAFLSRFSIKLFVNPIFSYIGKVSFSLYLCHLAVYYWLSKSVFMNFLPSNQYLNFFIRFSLLLSFSLVISSIFFFTIERGGIILGKKLINHFEKVNDEYISTNAKIW